MNPIQIPIGPEFSFFKGGITVTTPTHQINLSDCIDLIRSNRYAKLIRELRNADDVGRKSLKTRLDYVTFSGSFAPTRQAKHIQQHSGLICLDYDHVEHFEERRRQFQADPYTLALFTSPSGTGLKVVVAINQLAKPSEQAWSDRHNIGFQALRQYFSQAYKLEADASGSDVSRACFLPYDPEVFFNPNAIPYYLPVLPISTSASLSSTIVKANKKPKCNYAHVLAVVERIERAQIDISGGPGEYGNRLMLAFCLSTLGEDGRSLLHRTLAFYPNYTPEETNDKFDQGLAKCTFSTPGKFFKLAKEHGIDVSKPPPSPESQEANRKESKDTRVNFASPVIYYEKEYRITIDAKRGYNTVADNFLLYVRYRTIDENGLLTWILEIRTSNKDPIYFEALHDEFTSATKLKKIITGHQYSLQVTDPELSLLQAYLFRSTSIHQSIKIIRYGYHVPSGIFFFANKAVLPQKAVLVPDSFGMVQTTASNGEILFFSMPQNNKHKAHRFTLTDTIMNVNRFFQLFAQAHTYQIALLTFCHYTMALFRDIAIRHKNFSPILYLKGGSGTGKSSLIRVLTAAFGLKQEGVNLKSKNTISALVKIMSQGSNVVLWFDEFHNDLNGVEGLLQAAYDNDGYHRSRDSTSSDTDAIEIHSALALTSNYIPENTIFFSRCIFIPITSQDKTAEQRAAYNQLHELEDAGLGCLTVELLQHRALVETEYAAAYEDLYVGLKQAVKTEKVPERFFANMAQLMTVNLILTRAGKIQLTESTDTVDIMDEFIKWGAVNINRQFRVTAERTALTEFFEIIQLLYDQHQIHEEVHFRFVRDGEQNKILLWFPQLYSLYAQTFRRTYQKAPADKDTLQSEMAAFEDYANWEELRKSIRFRNDGEGVSTSTSTPRTGCCVMNYDKLSTLYGLQLDNRKSR